MTADTTAPWRLGPRSGRAAAAVIVRAASALEPAPVRLWWLNPVTWLLLGALELYRRRVPDARKHNCRLEPSCSRYASAALRRYGAIGGTRATARQLLRCAGLDYEDARRGLPTPASGDRASSHPRTLTAGRPTEPSELESPRKNC